MRLAVSMILAAAVLAACSVDPTQPPKRGGASSAPRAERSAKIAQAGPSAAPSGQAAPRARTTFPPVASTAVTGLVKLDASYMVAAGAGNIVAAGAGNIVAAGAGNIVAAGAGLAQGGADPRGARDGGSGGNLVGMDGGTLIGADGASLVGPDGASLVGPDGASLVGADGGSMVAAGAGNLVAAGGGNYRLTGLPAFRLRAADAPAAGTQLPASWMRVRIYNLETGQPVLAARDPAARAGAFVMTDAQGRYTAPVLAASAGNVLVVADALGANDPRLELTGIARPAAGGVDASIDEDQAVVSYYLRLIVSDRLKTYMREAGEQDGTINHGTTPVSKGEVDLANQAFGRIVAAAKQQRVYEFPEDRLDALVQRMQDVILAHMPLREIDINKQWTPEWAAKPDEKAFEALVGLMRRCNQAAAAKLQASGGSYFQPAQDAARAAARPALGGRPAGHLVGYQDIRKPGDVARFLIKRHVANAEAGAFFASASIFHDLGLEEDERHHLKAAIDGYLLWVFSHLAFDLPPDDDQATPGMLTQLVAAIAQSDATGGGKRAIPPPDRPAAPKP